MTRPFRIAPYRVGTALDHYDRLEALGLWRESPDSDPREVVVAFGTSTLVLRDGADSTVGHWSLAGVRTVARDGEATVYAMTPDGYETLAIRDRDMVAAIDAVTAAARGFPAPRQGRPRRWPFAIAALAVLAALVYAAPPILHTQAVRMVPPEVAERLGGDMLLRLLETHGPLCAEPAGTAALSRLAEAAGAGASRVQVLDLPAPAAALPGDLVLLDRDLAAEAESPEEIAGWLLLAQARVATAPPVATLMADAGPLSNLRYILTGALPESVLTRATEALLAADPLPHEAIPTLTRDLASAGIPAEALAAGLRRTGSPAAADALVAAGHAVETDPLLLPRDWAALRRICG